MSFRMQHLFTGRSLLLLLAVAFAWLPVHANEWKYTVRPGDTLWSLTDSYLIDQSYRERLAEHNSIADSDRISPGVVLSVPVEWLKAPPANATLLHFSGQVRILRDGVSVVASNELALFSGDEVSTAPGATLTIEFADASVVELKPETSIRLDAISSFDENGMVDTSYRLRGGRVHNRVNPDRDDNSRFRVLTPPAIAGVRGTDFDIAYNVEDATMLAEVDTGEIAVGAQGVEVSVPAGFGLATREGEAPGTPRQRLSAPQLDSLPPIVAAQGDDLEWAPVEGSARYSTTLWDGSRQSVVQSREVEPPELTLAALAPGTYFLEVQAVDPDGLRGFLAAHRFGVVDALPAPRPLRPADEAWRRACLHA